MPHIPIHRLPASLLDMSPKTMSQRAMQLPPHGRTQYRKGVTMMRGLFNAAWQQGIARLFLIPDKEWKRKGGE